MATWVIPLRPGTWPGVALLPPVEPLPSAPKKLSPHVHTVPLASRAALTPPPATIWVISAPPKTSAVHTGELRWVNPPSPSSPCSSLPQAQMGGAFEATAGADAATIRPTTPTVSMAASRASHRDRRMTFIAFLLNPKRSR